MSNELRIEYTVDGFPFRPIFTGENMTLLVEEATEHLTWAREHFNAQPPAPPALAPATDAAGSTPPKLTPATREALKYDGLLVPDPKRPGEIGQCRIWRWKMRTARDSDDTLILGYWRPGAQFKRFDFLQVFKASWRDEVLVPAEIQAALDEQGWREGSSSEIQMRATYRVADRQREGGGHYLELLALEIDDGMLPVMKFNGAANGGNGAHAGNGNGGSAGNGTHAGSGGQSQAGPAPSSKTEPDPSPATQTAPQPPGDPTERPDWFGARSRLITALKNQLSLHPLKVKELLDTNWDAGRIPPGMMDADIVAALAGVSDDVASGGATGTSPESEPETGAQEEVPTLRRMIQADKGLCPSGDYANAWSVMQDAKKRGVELDESDHEGTLARLRALYGQETAAIDWNSFLTVKTAVKEAFELETDAEAVALLEAAEAGNAFLIHEPITVQDFTAPRAVDAIKTWQQIMDAKRAGAKK